MPTAAQVARPLQRDIELQQYAEHYPHRTPLSPLIITSWSINNGLLYCTFKYSYKQGRSQDLLVGGAKR